MPSCSRDKNDEKKIKMKMKAGTAVVGRGEEGPLFDPSSELRLEGRAMAVEGSKRDEENIIMQRVFFYFPQ